MTTTPRCSIHPSESASACFSCYLSQPCDDEGCNYTATHNGQHRDAPHVRGKFCNGHTSWNHYARARDD